MLDRPDQSADPELSRPIVPARPTPPSAATSFLRVTYAALRTPENGTGRGSFDRGCRLSVFYKMQERSGNLSSRRAWVLSQAAIVEEEFSDFQSEKAR